ncbi:hypothetical protein D6C93_06793 [Aureobasidium pullulans]|nr:hypothetical protein D6C93_06793 [Aureobasidium pullulans]
MFPTGHRLAPYGTTTYYMQQLAQQNITHLYEQRNSIDNADDARRKSTASLIGNEPALALISFYLIRHRGWCRIIPQAGSIAQRQCKRPNSQYCSVNWRRRKTDSYRRIVSNRPGMGVKLLLESFNFDEQVLWPNIEPILQGRRLDHVGTPEEAEVDEFVAATIKDLKEYQQLPEENRGDSKETGSRLKT